MSFNSNQQSGDGKDDVEDYGLHTPKMDVDDQSQDPTISVVSIHLLS